MKGEIGEKRLVEKSRRKVEKWKENLYERTSEAFHRRSERLILKA
jgi:hypothetical protein